MGATGKMPVGRVRQGCLTSNAAPGQSDGQDGSLARQIPIRTRMRSLCDRARAELICKRAGLIAAAQNRVVQVGRVSFSGINGSDHSLTFCIYPNVVHSRDAHERFAQFADAFIAIFAFRRDGDSLQHRFVCAVRIVRVGWIEMLGIEWLDHWSIYAPSAALSSRAERGISPMVCNIRISNSHRRQRLLTRDISQCG